VCVYVCIYVCNATEKKVFTVRKGVEIVVRIESLQNSNFACFYGCETWLLALREERKLRISENRMLRRIFGPKRDEATGEWRTLHNDELSGLYCSPNIVRVVKSRIRWAGHVACMKERRCVYRVLVRKPERDNLEDPATDGRIILRWIIRKLDMVAWIGSIWLRIGIVGRHLCML